MNKSKMLGLALAAWLALEIIAFMFVAQAIGLFAALLLGVFTTALGLSDVRRLLEYLRSRAARARAAPDGDGALLDRALQALASLLLILPGFVSDFAGLALKSPSVRASLARRLREKNVDPRLIDLSPGEWRHESAPKPSKQPKPRAPRKRAQKRAAE